jgi:periplasmic divalent cation tolerance protein
MKPKHTFVVVSTTAGSETDAQTLASRIVEERLAACVQCLPIRSTYRWKGAVENASEQLLLCKTRASLAPKLTDLIRSIHPYELPEILVTSVRAGLPEYLNWILQETTGADGRGTAVREAADPPGNRRNPAVFCGEGRRPRRPKAEPQRKRRGRG